MLQGHKELLEVKALQLTAGHTCPSISVRRSSRNICGSGCLKTKNSLWKYKIWKQAGWWGPKILAANQTQERYWWRPCHTQRNTVILSFETFLRLWKQIKLHLDKIYSQLDRVLLCFCVLNVSIDVRGHWWLNETVLLLFVQNDCIFLMPIPTALPSNGPYKECLLLKTKKDVIILI